MAIYRIESRWPTWARWRIVGPKPHSERYPFDEKGLRFPTAKAAAVACDSMSTANASEYRIVEEEPMKGEQLQ